MTRTTKDIVEPLFREAKKAPFRIAPEREEELSREIFGANKWELNSAEGEAQLYALPQDGTVSVSNAAMASLWNLSFAAFHIMDVATRARRAEPSGKTFFDVGRELSQLNVRAHVDYARSLCSVDKEWPDELPLPNTSAKPNTAEWGVNNIFYGALSWILLHEIGHLHLKHEKLIPADERIRDEYAADEFATKWVLDDAGNGLLREFRVLMVAVAFAWLFLKEAGPGTGKDHPPAIVRFREAIEHFEVGARSVGIECAGYLFKAIFDPATPPPAFDTPSEQFDWVSRRLEELFPR